MCGVSADAPVTSGPRPAFTKGIAMRMRTLIGAVALSLPFVAAAGVEETTEPITWIRHMTVAPDQGERFVELLLEVDRPVFDGLLAQGKIRSWGIMTPITRGNVEWTHAIWVSAKNWSQIDEVMEGFFKAKAARTPEQNAKIERRFTEMLVPGSTDDLVIRHIRMPGRDYADTNTTEFKYLRLTHYKFDHARFDDVETLYDLVAAPVYGQLVADGTIAGAALSVQELAKTSEWTHTSVAMLPNLGAIDAINAAFEAAKEARSPEENDSIERELDELIDYTAVRTTLIRIVHYGTATGASASATD